MRIGFAIRVIDQEGNGVPDAEVTVHYPYAEDNGCTDEQGWVHFEKDHFFGNSVRANVYVDGQLRDEFICFEDGDTVSYTV